MPNKISIIFSDISVADINAYLKQRINLLHFAADRYFNHVHVIQDVHMYDDYVAAISADGKHKVDLPLTPAIDMSSLTGSNASELRDSYACMLKEISKLFPLLDGETVTSNEVSYFSESWEAYPLHAVCLKQTTNMSTCYYIYPGILADAENQQLVDAWPQATDTVSDVQLSVVGANIDFGSAAKILADGLCKFLPSPMNVIGATLISLFWPKSDDAAKQWQKVYEALQTIVKNGLAQNNVTQAAHKMKGFVTFLNTEYSAMKDTPSVTKEQLLSALAPYDTSFFMDIVNVFMFTESSEIDIASACLGNFMLGAGLHMALNQERALQDPGVSKPSDSAYAKTVSNLAKIYGEYARKTAPGIQKLRMDQIGDVLSRSNTNCHGGPAGGCTTTYYYWFEDHNNGYKSPYYSYNSSQKKPRDAKNDAVAARSGYYSRILVDMVTTLKSQVYDVVSSWERLITNPIPA